MDFKFSKKEEKFRSEIREFVKENLSSNNIFKALETHDEKSWEFTMSISKKLAERKWLTLSWPKEYGGMGVSVWEHTVFFEEVGYWGIPGTEMGISGTIWVGPSLILFGNEEQKEKFLPPIAKGDSDGIWCIVIFLSIGRICRMYL